MYSRSQLTRATRLNRISGREMSTKINLIQGTPRLQSSKADEAATVDRRKIAMRYVNKGSCSDDPVACKRCSRMRVEKLQAAPWPLMPVLAGATLH